MSPVLQQLTSALADRYRIERELGQGGMATASAVRLVLIGFATGAPR